MERVKTKISGKELWVYKRHTLLKWIQDFFISNIKKAFMKTIGTPGVFMATGGSDLKCEYIRESNSQHVYKISSGSGITANGDIIELKTPRSITVDEGLTRYVYLKFGSSSGINPKYIIPLLPSGNDSINIHERDGFTLNIDEEWPDENTLKDCLKIAIVNGKTITDSRQVAAFFNLTSLMMTWATNQVDALYIDKTTSNIFKLAHNSEIELVPLQEMTDLYAPKNLRIIDIDPVIDKPRIAVASVTFKYGWDGLYGVRVSGDAVNTITIDNSVSTGGRFNPVNVAKDELIGHTLIIPITWGGRDQNYTIIGNEPTSGERTKIYLDEDYIGLSFNFGIIRPTYNDIDVRAGKYLNGIEPENFKEYIDIDLASANFNKDGMTFRIELPITTDEDKYFYDVQIRTIYNNRFSSWGKMNPGQYYPSGASSEPISYQSIFECKLPNIGNGAGTIERTIPQSNTAIIRLTGWSNNDDPNRNAHKYRVILSEIKDSADTIIAEFKGDSYQFTWDDYSDCYAIVVPIQNNVIVGEQLKLTLNALTRPPSPDIVVFNRPINIYTFDVELASVDNTNPNYYKLSLVYVRYCGFGVDSATHERGKFAADYLNTSNVPIYFTSPSNKNYKIINRGSHYYSESNSTLTIYVEKASDEPGPVEQTASIGTFGREIGNAFIPNDCKITSVVYDIDDCVQPQVGSIKSSGSIVITPYKDQNPQAPHKILVNGEQTELAVLTSIPVYKGSDQTVPNIKISMLDSNVENNKICASGNIKLIVKG